MFLVDKNTPPPTFRRFTVQLLETTQKKHAFVEKTYKITPKGRNLATFLP